MTSTNFQVFNIIAWEGSGTADFYLLNEYNNYYTQVNNQHTDSFPVVVISDTSFHRNFIRWVSQPSVVIKEFWIKRTSAPTTGIAGNNINKTDVKAYPNPATDNLSVSFTTQNHKEKVEIFDIQGCLVMSDKEDRSIGENVLIVDVSKLNRGIYFVHVGSNTFKFIKL
jgi:hypothetical protein